MDITWTTEGVLSGLYAVVAVMLIIVLFNVLFIVVDARRIVRRVEKVTRELQTVILKPLAVTDQVLEWIMSMLNTHQKGKKPEFKNRNV